MTKALPCINTQQAAAKTISKVQQTLYYSKRKSIISPTDTDLDNYLTVPMPPKFKQQPFEQPKLKYLSAYSELVQLQVEQMLEQNTLEKYLLNKYPSTHEVTSDKALRAYVMTLKNQYLKKSSPLSQIKYDDKIHIINNALGLHTYVSRVQGNKLKSKNEIRIGSLFKKTPEAFLAMIVVHELAHLKEKEHNKAFYKLCQYMLSDYHQLEFDARVYLTQLEFFGEIYE